MFWEQFWPQLIATLIGIGLGIPAGIWLNHLIESKNAKEKRTKIMKLIREELNTNVQMLDEWLAEPTVHRLELLIIFPRFELWRAFSDGGELQWIKDTETLAYFAEAFASVRVVRELATSHYNMQFSRKILRDDPSSRLLYKNLVMATEFSIDMIEDAIRAVYKENIPTRIWQNFNTILLGTE